MSKDALQIALGILARGWNPVRLNRQTKKPIDLEWQKRRITRETVAEFFDGHDGNVGVQMGPHSSGLCDVDLDCPEAVMVGAMMLPKSNNIFGRKSKRRSHWLYNTTLAERVDKACLQFRDPVGGAMMLELKIGGQGKGSQSVFPGSVHVDSGEVIEWDQDGALVTVDDDKLYRSVHRLAVATTLARHWPVKGSRHDCALSTGGFLARAGLDADEAAEMMAVIATAAGDDESDDRERAARDAVGQYAAGRDTRGLPALVEAFGEKVAQKAAAWLGYKQTRTDKKTHTKDADDETDAEITRLAKLSMMAYEQQRKAAAEELGMRTSVLDKLVQAERAELGLDEGVKTAADVLIDLAGRAQELFHTPDGTAFATIPVADHLETWPVRSKGFRKWLAREYFNETSSAPNSDAIQSVLNVIEARAHFDSVERAVYMRVGAHEGRIYLDLVDKCWRAVEISADGWRIVERTPIPFRRPAGMRPLPEPVHGGSIDELRPFLNVEQQDDDRDFVLTVSFILAALRDCGPYPGLDLIGEHGSAKSTFTKVLRRLIDPNSAPLRALPREDRDLFIAANNAHLLAFDNVSYMPNWISDTLCRLATGGGFATRQLYSDQDEALFDAMRPVILNGIEDIVIRPDLADRSIFLNLKNVAESKRKAEIEFWRDFEAAHPRILGALLDGVAHGLRELPNTRLTTMPRMADFALWIAACERAFWKTGTFAQAYEQNREDAVGAVIEADTIATAVQQLMDERPDLVWAKARQLNHKRPDLVLEMAKQLVLGGAEGTQWAGTAADLLGALKRVVGEAKTKSKEWPATPRALASRVRRAAGTLRKVGIEITFERESGGRSHGNRTRTITITHADPERLAQFASLSSQPSPANEIKDLERDANRDAKRPTNFASHPSSPSNPLKNNDKDDGDDRDAKSATRTERRARSGQRKIKLPGFAGIDLYPPWSERQ
jgi:hypothetical protein